MGMNLVEAAKILDGRQYGEEISKENELRLKLAGIVAVFGASDDLCELRGAIVDEVDCWEGGLIGITNDGKLFERECECEDCPHEFEIFEKCRQIKILWYDDGDFSWTYETEIPHETFIIKDEGDDYCRGIVFYAKGIKK